MAFSPGLSDFSYFVMSASGSSVPPPPSPFQVPNTILLYQEGHDADLPQVTPRMIATAFEVGCKMCLLDTNKFSSILSS